MILEKSLIYLAPVTIILMMFDYLAGARSVAWQCLFHGHRFMPDTTGTSGAYYHFGFIVLVFISIMFSLVVGNVKNEKNKDKC